VEFVNFGRSLPQMLDATSTSKSTKAHKAYYRKFLIYAVILADLIKPYIALGERSFTFIFCDVVFSVEKGRT
jgi:hypothetical protein